MPESGRVRHPSIGKAVRDKASKYGKLALPLIIAVNASGLYLRTPHVLQYHMMGKFFGLVVGIDSLRSHGTIDRRVEGKPNGAWHGLQGPRNTRVSAVLIVACSDPWTLANQTPVLFHHPWAEHPLPSWWCEATNGQHPAVLRQTSSGSSEGPTYVSAFDASSRRETVMHGHSLSPD
jgi:hypothetical protein